MTLIVGMGSYYLAVKITDSFNILVTGAWAGLVNLLLGPLYLLYFIPIMAFIFFLLWNLMDYLLIKSNIIEKEVVDNQTLESKSIWMVAKNTFIWTSISVVTIYTLLFSFLSLINKSMSSTFSKNYEKTFYIISYTNDYNDSRILFYKSEIEESSRAYIEAKNDYDIFEAFTKKEMGLECIKTLLIEHTNSDNIYRLGNSFSQNSRNKYVQTKALIVKYKEHENSFHKKHGAYRSSIIDPFSRFLKKNMPNRCEKKVPVEKMYQLFIPEYIKKREVEQTSYKSIGVSNNSNYIRQKIEDLTSWIEVVRRKHQKNENQEETQKFQTQ